MSIADGYHYVAEVTSLAGDALGNVALTPDWRPALEWAHWEGVRQGKVPPLARCPGGTIEPIWDSELGEPRVEGVRTTLEPADAIGPPLSFWIPRHYFTSSVDQHAPSFVSSGKLQAGERFLYEVCAFPKTEAEDAHADPRAVSFTVEDIPQSLALGSASLETLRGTATYRAPPVACDGEMAVFIPRVVIDEAAELAREAGEVETGGVLVGRVYRDTGGVEVFSVITAQIAAKHTNADRTFLTFTPATWTAVRAAIDLRDRGEIMAGWWHSHPHFCAACPRERQRLCPLSRPFFSKDDAALHGTVFGRGFDVALLLSDLGTDDLACDLFGWRYGMVAHRGYYVMGDSPVNGGESQGGAEDGPAPVDDGYGPRRDGACITEQSVRPMQP